MKIYLRDRNTDVVEEWWKQFGDVDDVDISCGDIFVNDIRADAIVSPSNSFGFMDGGIDLAYARHFGWHLEDRLRKAISDEHDGEPLVGQAQIIETRTEKTPWLISAPTMRVPMNVANSPNAFLAFRAVLQFYQEGSLI